ncbi:hypothetical protein RchiOBHm_Chr2g0092011 [Rosa chinensis]|uniref:Uncharacterized protein n=1 Tax=Rosa chinensis TaxID=74649 RepID=A0A2P6RJX9_ROSCH|nr:hypothetical protein RchiOBHm_Chr2g0092011 [Rosa chinensis]
MHAKRKREDGEIIYIKIASGQNYILIFVDYREEEEEEGTVIIINGSSSSPLESLLLKLEEEEEVVSHRTRRTIAPGPFSPGNPSPWSQQHTTSARHNKSGPTATRSRVH